MKKIRKNMNNMNKIIIICNICIFFVFLCIFIFSKQIFAKDKEKNVTNSIKIYKNENPINIEEILEENIKNIKQEEFTIEEFDLEYTTIYKNNSELPNGTIQVIQEGRNGKQNVVCKKIYENGEIVSEDIVFNSLVKSSVNKIVEIGTGGGKNTYIPKVGDIVYVTPSELAVRISPDKESEKTCTLRKEDEVKILKIEKEWIYIDSSENKGYIQKDCVTNIAPNTNMESESSRNNNYYSKNELTKKLSFNMNLNNPSNLSLEQFEKVLNDNAQDKNNIFKDNAKYFYYSEKQYNINGVFLAAVAIHESNWGTSKISLDKKNLFGYGAYDSSPYNSAYEFSTYSEGIDLLARVFVKYYLNPAGTKIYDGNIANGNFYSGNTISSVNIKYASDKNWANSVYRWMQYLYNKL